MLTIETFMLVIIFVVLMLIFLLILHVILTAWCHLCLVILKIGLITSSISYCSCVFVITVHPILSMFVSNYQSCWNIGGGKGKCIHWRIDIKWQWFVSDLGHVAYSMLFTWSNCNLVLTFLPCLLFCGLCYFDTVLEWIVTASSARTLEDWQAIPFWASS